MDSYKVESPANIEAKALYSVWYEASKSMGGKPQLFENLSEVQQRAWKTLAKKLKSDLDSYKAERMAFVKEVEEAVGIYEQNMAEMKAKLAEYENK